MSGRVVGGLGGVESGMRDKELLLAPVAEFTRRRRVQQDGHHREVGYGIAPQFEVKREGRAVREGGRRRDQRRSEALRCDRGKAVVISTFTSAQEREALRRSLGMGRQIVAVLPGGIPPESELAPELAVACREGRALLLSPQETGSALTKKAATWCNEYVLRHADEIWTGDIAEGGMLATLLRAPF